MLILGLESSCDETAAAVVEDGVHVRSNVVASQVALHEEYAGVVPEIASRAHVEQILPVLREALAQAGVGLGRIDAIAVGNRPGLIGCLLVGVNAAKALAWSLNVPLVGVDHVAAHLYSGMLHERDDLVIQDGAQPAPTSPGLASSSTHAHTELFPALGLVISGGHTAMYALESWTKAARIGTTIDDAVGEAYDKVAAILGLAYPGGPNVDRLAREEGANPKAVALPVSRLGNDSLDFSFSGLKTAVLYAARGVPGQRDRAGTLLDLPPALDHVRKRDIAASFQATAAKTIILKLERALAVMRASHPSVKSFFVGGGVSANSRIRVELEAFAKREGLTYTPPRLAYCVDNAAMIAGLGYWLLQAQTANGLPAPHGLDLEAMPTTSMA